jgi:hypothetical protein
VRRGSEDGGGVPVSGVPESDREVAGKFLREDVVLMVSLLRAERWQSVGTAASRSGGGGKAYRRRGPAAWVRGNGIELVRDLQWEVGVLAEHWVEHVGRRRRLTTAAGVVAELRRWWSGGEEVKEGKCSRASV